MSEYADSAADSSDHAPEWRPCRPEVQNCVAFIRDSLTAAGLTLVIEQDDLNPNCWVLVAQDDAGYENFGLISWNDEQQAVVYAAHKPEVENHDVAEGLPVEESKAWWSPVSAEMMAMFLKGDVRRLVARYRAALLAAAKEEDLGGEAA